MLFKIIGQLVLIAMRRFRISVEEWDMFLTIIFIGKSLIQSIGKVYQYHFVFLISMRCNYLGSFGIAITNTNNPICCHTVTLSHCHTVKGWPRQVQPLLSRCPRCQGVLAILVNLKINLNKIVIIKYLKFFQGTLTGVEGSVHLTSLLG